MGRHIGLPLQDKIIYRDNPKTPLLIRRGGRAIALTGWLITTYGIKI